MPVAQPYKLIDPPVGPFSPEKDILAWKDRLSKMPESPQRDRALRYADTLLGLKVKANG